MILLLLLAMCLLIYGYMKWKNPAANNILAPIALFSCADFVSDVLFIQAIRDIPQLGLLDLPGNA